MLEHTLYQPLIQGALEAGWSLFRIQDGSAGRKPFDIAGADRNGHAVGLEVKVINREPAHYEQLPWQKFELHQRAWLKRYRSAIAVALMGFYVEQSGTMFILAWPTDIAESEVWEDWPKLIMRRDGKVYRGWQELQILIERDVCNVASFTADVERSCPGYQP